MSTLPQPEAAPGPCASPASCSFSQDVGFYPVSIGSDPDLWLYRERTVALLRRYLRISIEVGRLPSLLGRELFRSKVTSYRMSSFEDGVIFVHDVEHALDKLDPFARQLIAAMIFHEYTQDEASEVLNIGRRTIVREYPLALDQISEIFLEGGLLNRLPTSPVEKSCQGGLEGQFPLNDCNCSE